MGADPAWATLALTLPKVDELWVQKFSEGMFSLARQFNVQLVGGDTSRGPLAVTIQACGFVPTGQAIRRANAKVGDSIYVTGSIGDAGLGLLYTQGKIKLGSEQERKMIERLHRPEPRVPEGLALRAIVHAAIDVSDGLLADLGHILKASKVGARIDVDTIPVSPLYSSFNDDAGGWDLPLSAGDDYELCFTAAADNRQLIESIFADFECGCQCIGAVEEQPGLRCMLDGKQVAVPEVTGYQHFI